MNVFNRLKTRMRDVNDAMEVILSYNAYIERFAKCLKILKCRFYEVVSRDKPCLALASSILKLLFHYVYYLIIIQIFKLNVWACAFL